MRKKIVGILICTLLIATVIPVVGQINKISISKEADNKINPLAADKWMKTYGGSGQEFDGSAQQTSDGGYIIIGITYSLATKDNTLLIKTDSSGNKMWEKTFGGENNDCGRVVKQTNDGGYIIVGYTATEGSMICDVWLIKLDGSGNKIWDKTFDFGGIEWGFDVIEISSGGFLIVGQKGLTGDNWFNTDVLLIKTDADGNKIWDKTFVGGDVHDEGRSVQELNDGGYIITGTILADDNSYVWLLRTNVDGDLIWDKKYTKNGMGNGMSVMQTTDNGFIIAGETASDIGFYRLWLLKTDSEGNLVWDKILGGNKETFCGSAQQTSDGGYIVCGYTGLINVDGLLIKTDSNGNEEWSKTYGGLRVDVIYSVQQTVDGGYILGGHYTKILSNPELWLIKTDANGNAPNIPNSHSRDMTKQKMFSLFPNLYIFLERLPILEKLLNRLGQ